MQTTMHLLEKALSKQPATYWTKKLNLARTTLATAKVRGHLSPSIAGALADELGEDYQKWFVIGALESERDSACKTRMVRKLLTGAAITLGAASPALAKAVCILCKVDPARQQRISERLERLNQRKKRSSLTK